MSYVREILLAIFLSGCFALAGSLAFIVLLFH